ncbi:MAG: hypothetical protein BMS9Abin29_0198 [Gemmatimonadota bacterium]|nr:MAG: hypothetical protein BMS9Abin29_0198 [Gemmatimonadota bacterium]
METASSNDATGMGMPVAMLAHLSGSQRGQSDRISGETILVGTSAEAQVWLSADNDPPPGAIHAVLRRRGLTYEIEAGAGQSVWVNGQSVEGILLASGDLLEMGKGGPILRFRLYPPGSPAYKRVSEAFEDCRDCARYSDRGALGRAAMVVLGMRRELATETSGKFRASVMVLLVALVASTALLTWRSLRLEQRLSAEVTRVAGMAQLLERAGVEGLSGDQIARLRGEIDAQLASASTRIEELEARSGAVGRILASASSSTLFLQGGYAFRDPASGRFLRLVEGPGGLPVRNLQGEPALTLEGSGKILEVFYTGTGIIIDSPRGFVISNRHVALPWEVDAPAQALRRRGFEPVMRRFVAYVPGITGAFDIALVRASDAADVAVLKVEGLPADHPALAFSTTNPRPGDEVLVLGYPLGVRALVVRTDQAFLEGLTREGATGFWSIAERLSAAGHIAPLASRGIVGQVTSRAVVYDAETTSGGSGGPVLNMDGAIVAVNAAILPEFGGSNLGVPAAASLALVDGVESEGN